jgi:hypothetical protein
MARRRSTDRLAAAGEASSRRVTPGAADEAETGVMGAGGDVDVVVELVVDAAGGGVAAARAAANASTVVTVTAGNDDGAVVVVVGDGRLTVSPRTLAVVGERVTGVSPPVDPRSKKTPPELATATSTAPREAAMPRTQLLGTDLLVRGRFSSSLGRKASRASYHSLMVRGLRRCLDQRASTMGRLSFTDPVEPRNFASPKVKTPPSEATSQ